MSDSFSSDEIILEDPPCFYAHKAGESISSYQDAYDYNLSQKRYAVADGATLSFFPAQWAHLLVKRFCQDNDPENSYLFNHRQWEQWLQPIQQRWKDQVRQKVERTDPKTGFHVRNRFRRREAALATFVGLQLNLSDKRQMNWAAMIIGDSCLFHVQGNTITSYLISSTKRFGYTPEGFLSIDMYNYKYQPKFKSGIFEDGDFFILATDAMAKWLLSQYESGNWLHAWSRLCQMTWDDFPGFVEEIRHEVDNDDITFIIVPIGDQAKEQLINSVGIPQPTPYQNGALEIPVVSHTTIDAFFHPRSKHDSPQVITMPESKEVKPASVTKNSLLEGEIQTLKAKIQHLNKVIERYQQKFQKTETTLKVLRRISLAVAAFLLMSGCLNIYLLFGQSDKFVLTNMSSPTTPAPTVAADTGINNDVPTITASIPTLTLTPLSPEPTPTLPLPTVTPIPPSPTFTSTPIPPTSTLTSTPVQPVSSEVGPTPSKILLPLGSSIYQDIFDNRVLLLTTQKEIEALILNEVPDQGELQIEIVLWSIANLGQNIFTTEEGGKIFVQQNVNTRNVPVVANETLVGNLRPGFSFQKVGEQTDTEGNIWYQFKLIGYIQKSGPERESND